MDTATLLVALGVSVLVGTAVARRLDIPPPLFLVVAGATASYLPGVPEIHLSADVVLFGLLPPLLYAAAISTSLVDFNANRRPILLLSVGLVAFTTVGVAVVVHAVLPGVGWPAAFAIGAVVAPPDAVAATAIGRRIGLPRRIVTILEGESLLNDATALVALRTAVAAGAAVTAVTAVTTSTGLDVAWHFVRAAGGGLLVGLLAYLVVAWLRRHVTDPLMDTAISLTVPFVAYIAAEHPPVHGSGVLAVVVSGLLLGHQAPVLQTAQSRIAERINWGTIAFGLENTVFLLIGLQTEWLLADVGASVVPAGRIVAVCALTLVAVMVLRMVWVFPVRHLLVRPGTDRESAGHPPWQHTLVLGWAGMRGVVTLAAAFVIPRDTPHREILLLVAFTVVAGTLLVQGTTLGWLARRLAVPGPDPVDDALARATLLQQASKAAFEKLDELRDGEDPHGVVDAVRQRVEQRNFAAWERLGVTAGEEPPSETYARLRRAMIVAERERVLEIRSSGSVPSEVVADVLAMLDVEESMLDVATRQREEIRMAGSVRPPGGLCDDLAAYPAVETSADPVCQRCLDEGLRWVALRQCLTCGRVGCCDSSPGRHATAHFRAEQHPVVESAEPGEVWRWCYVHHVTA